MHTIIFSAIENLKADIITIIFGRNEIMKKRIMAALVAAAAVLSLAGCNTNNTSTPAASGDTGSSTPAASGGESSTGAGDASGADVTITDDDDTLTILAWSSNSDMQNLIDFFCEKNGIDKSKVVWSQQGSNGEGAREQYKQYLSGDGDADLILCDADWTVDYLNSDLTVPLSAVGITKDTYTDAYPYTLAIGTAENGDFKAVSWQCTPGGFLYRADLAEQYLGVKTPDDMQALVSDWDKFEETAKKLLEASGNATSLTATEGGLWQVFQTKRNSPWVVDNKLVLDTAEDFYEMAKNYKDNKYMAAVPQWDAAWYAAVKSGTALGDFVPTWGLTNANGSIAYNFASGGDEGAAAEEGTLALCEGPSSWYWGGTYMMVPAKCNSKTLVKQFLDTFTSNADTMKEYSLKTGDFMNNKTVMKSIVDEGSNKNPLLKDGQDQFAVLYSSADKIDLDGKLTKYDSIIKGKFNDSVNNYIDGKTASKEDAIVEFKKSVKAAYPDLTVE